MCSTSLEAACLGCATTCLTQDASCQQPDAQLQVTPPPLPCREIDAEAAAARVLVGQKRKAETMLDYEQYYPTMLPLRSQGQELTEEEMLEAPVGPPDLAAEQVCRPEVCAGSTDGRLCKLPWWPWTSHSSKWASHRCAWAWAAESPACLPALQLYASSASLWDLVAARLATITVILAKWLMEIGSFRLASTPL